MSELPPTQPNNFNSETDKTPEFSEKEPTIDELLNIAKKHLSQEYYEEINDMTFDDALGFFYTACFENGLDPDEILLEANFIENE